VANASASLDGLSTQWSKWWLQISSCDKVHGHEVRSAGRTTWQPVHAYSCRRSPEGVEAADAFARARAGFCMRWTAQARCRATQGSEHLIWAT
jgi:hypothetical protein